MTAKAAIRSALARALSPALLAEAVGLIPEPWQRRALESELPRAIYLVSRQGGKTSTVAIAALHALLYEPGSLVMVVSPSERQSSEVHRRIVGYYRELGRPVPAESETATTLTLVNGSRLVALPSNEARIRGYSAPRLLIVDEAARVPNDLWEAIYPMVATSPTSRILLATTPWGRDGWFFDLYERGEGWERTVVPATEVARISPAFLEEAKRTLPSFTFEQEFLCRFREGGGDAAFDLRVVEAAVDDALEVWWEPTEL